MPRAHGLAYEIHGAGEPVLLIHGSHIADAFLPVAREPALAERYRLIRYHRRGFAGSDRHTGSFGIEAQARDALRLAEALGLERCHVVGQSYGAVIALQLALDAPHAVQSLVLLEPPFPIPDADPAAAAGFASLVQRYAAGDARGAVDAFMEIVGGKDWAAALEQAVPGAPEQAYGDAATFFEVELPALQAWRFDVERARRLAPPVLFALGSESGPLFERPRDLFMASVPRAEEIVLPGVNHFMLMQAPALVARTVADFVARHPL